MVLAIQKIFKLKSKTILNLLLLLLLVVRGGFPKGCSIAPFLVHH